MGQTMSDAGRVTNCCDCQVEDDDDSIIFTQRRRLIYRPLPDIPGIILSDTEIRKGNEPLWLS